MKQQNKKQGNRKTKRTFLSSCSETVAPSLLLVEEDHWE